MNLKQRFSLLFSLLFSGLLAVMMLVVYTLFSNFRTEEFKDRLEEKAENTIMLLLKVKEIDYNMLKTIDRNTIQKLYNEKVLVFDQNMHLIYSSIDDAPLKWSESELQEIKKRKTVFKRYGEYDVFGMYYDFEYRDYFVLVSAEDTNGYRKLEYLRYLLIGSFLSSSSVVWLLSFYLSRRALKPLDILRKQIADITDKNLNTRLPARVQEDEVSSITHSFNEMLGRIDMAYTRQKVFTANASHELRTPITRIVTQLENLLEENQYDAATVQTIKQISEDCYQLSDIVTSLLLLSQMEASIDKEKVSKVRLDEIIFYSVEQLTRTHPDFIFLFEIEDDNLKDANLEVAGDETLLRIALGNVLKNGYNYSADNTVTCILKPRFDSVQMVFINNGDNPGVADTSVLFNTFTRGSNTQNKPGSGIGLSIVQRILHYHNASIKYQMPNAGVNEVVITFYYES